MQFTKALQHTIVWKAVNMVLVFCINLLLVRIFGPQDSGDFFYALTTLSLFILIISCSIESGLTYHGSNDPANIPTLSLLILPWLVLQAGASWLLLRLFDIELDQGRSWIFVISNLVIIYVSALYYSKKWFHSLNLSIAFVNAAAMLSLCWLYFRPQAGNDNASADLAATVYIGSFLFQALLLTIMFFARAGFKAQFAAVSQLAKKVFAYSAIALISNILFFLVTRMDYYFVQKYCDDTALSNYVQVSRLGQLFILLPSMIATVLFPYSSGIAPNEYLGKLKVVCRLITMLFIPVVIFIAVFGRWLFPFLFGNGFTQMYAAMIWYLPGFYALSLVTLLAAHLAGRAMLMVNLWASLISLAIVITGDFLLIPLYGINGAAAVSSVAYLTCLACLLRVYKNRLSCSYHEFFDFKKTDTSALMSTLKK
jgi:O-antigen/teichoic acid export membrane protein